MPASDQGDVRRENEPDSWSFVLPLVIVGIGAGWLVGLSISPVVSVVVASITGSAAAVIAALSGLERSSRWKINPWPLAVLVLGLVAGAVMGILARNGDWLGRDPSYVAQKWRAAGLALTQEEIVRRLFDQAYPPLSAGPILSATPLNWSGTVLYQITQEECQSLQGKQDQELVVALRNSNLSELRRLPDIVLDAAGLKRLVDEVFCGGGS